MLVCMTQLALDIGKNYTLRQKAQLHLSGMRERKSKRKKGLHGLWNSLSQHFLPTVCHERTKGFYTPKCGAAQEMRVGPSKSAVHPLQPAANI